MKKNHCVLNTIIAVLLCCMLFGCDSADPSVGNVPILTDTCGEERLYQSMFGGSLTPIDLGEDSHVLQNAAVYITDDGVFLPHSVGGSAAVTQLSLDGTVQKT